jgi:hypothetical protein
MTAVAFQFACSFRFRPNARPRLVYLQQLTADADAVFQWRNFAVQLYGRDDECSEIAAAYKLIHDIGQKRFDAPLGTAILTGAQGFAIEPQRGIQPGESFAVRLAIPNGGRVPPKLLRRIDGGQGVTVALYLRGVKEYAGV